MSSTSTAFDAHVVANLLGDFLSDLESRIGGINGRVVAMLILRSDDAWMPFVDLAVVEDEVRHEGLDIVTILQMGFMRCHCCTGLKRLGLFHGVVKRPQGH